MELFKETVAAGILILTLLMLITAMVSLFIRVPFVPTKKRVMEKMIKVAQLKKNEVVYDLGCGDGRLLFEAEKNKKILAKGYELAPIPYLLAQMNKIITRSRTSLHMANFFSANLKDANVIFCYLGPETMKNLYTKIKKECKKGTRIISNTFSIHGVKPSKVWLRDDEQKLPTIYLYEI